MNITCPNCNQESNSKSKQNKSLLCGVCYLGSCRCKEIRKCNRCHLNYCSQCSPRKDICKSCLLRQMKKVTTKLGDEKYDLLDHMLTFVNSDELLNYSLVCKKVHVLCVRGIQKIWINIGEDVTCLYQCQTVNIQNMMVKYQFKNVEVVWNPHYNSVSHYKNMMRYIEDVEELWLHLEQYEENVDCKKISKLRRCKNLHLSSNRISNGEKIFEMFGLEEIHLYNVNLIKLCNTEIRKLTNLRILTLNVNGIETSHFTFLEGLTNLRTLNVCRVDKKFNEEVKFPVSLVTIRTLYISSDTVLAFMPLKNLTNLCSMSIRATTEINLNNISVGLKSLQIHGCQINNTISRFINLEELKLTEVQINDVTFAWISTLTKLQQLELHDTPITSYCYVDNLTNLTNLMVVNCDQC